MKVTLNWETIYKYESPVQMVHTELRVLPVERWGQRIVSRSINSDPETPVGVTIDAFGNEVHRIGFLGGIHEFCISADAEVITPDGHQPSPEELTPLRQYLALQETKRSHFDDIIAQIADSVGPSDDRFLFALKLMETIADRFEFKVGASDVASTAKDLIESGAGVCQDFSHLMTAALRMRGIPAYYVSGYLAPKEGVEESVASHAWVHAYVDGAWYGFDPANNQRQDGRYVMVNVGRDYDDVAPIRGSVRGLTQEDYTTTLSVHAEQYQEQQQ